MHEYGNFLLAESKTPGLAKNLSDSMQALAFDLQAYLAGLGASASKFRADNNTVISLCTRYGVTRGLTG